MTTAAILQPGYLPWLGYFEQMECADVFVHMDDVPFTRKDWRSRNRIRLHDKPHWLSVPVHKQPLGTSIRDMRIDYSQNWVHKHRSAVESAYRKAPYYQWLADAIFPILEDREEFLVDLDVRLAMKLRECFQIKTPCFFSSALKVTVEEQNGSNYRDMRGGRCNAAIRRASLQGVYRYRIFFWSGDRGRVSGLPAPHL